MEDVHGREGAASENAEARGLTRAVRRVTIQIMKDIYVGYYRPDEEQFKTLWAKGLFVFETSILLNLYRFPRQAREDLIASISKVKDRVWLPHFVGLEYQRNRHSQIADQKAKFQDVRASVCNALSQLRKEFEDLQLKKRHSTIDVDAFLARLQSVSDAFNRELDELESRQPDVSDSDPVRDQLEEIFAGKIGPPPPNQTWLDDLYECGKRRFDRRVPPGYLDSKKSNDPEQAEFEYGGLCYQRKFGDLIWWQQLLDHVKDRGIKYLVVVSDDAKEDWWRRVKGKTVGPRPELAEELNRVAGVDCFHMYSSEGFLEQAKRELGVAIHADSASQVEDVKRVSDAMEDGRDQYPQFVAVSAVNAWLHDRFGSDEVITGGLPGPDFLVADRPGDLPVGFNVVASEDTNQLLRQTWGAIHQSGQHMRDGNVRRVEVIVVAQSSLQAARVGEHFGVSRPDAYLTAGKHIGIVLAYLSRDDRAEQGYRLHVFGDFNDDHERSPSSI